LFNFRLNLIKELKEKGFKVFLVVPMDYYVNKLPFEYNSIKLNSKIINPIHDLFLILRFYKIYKKINPDIIIHFTIKPNIYGTIAARLCHIPCINNITSMGILFTRKNFITKIAVFLYKITKKYAYKVCFQNRFDQRSFIKLGIIKKEKTMVLPGSGVDVEKFKPIECFRSDKFKFLLFGRMLWEKWVGLYIDAARILNRKYKNLEFLLLGFVETENPSSINRKQIKDWVKEGIINYLGNTDDVRKIIAIADCVVLPSFYMEGIPRSLLEACSMGKLVPQIFQVVEKWLRMALTDFFVNRMIYTILLKKWKR